MRWEEIDIRDDEYVYAIYRTGELLYVGKTVNVHARISDHRNSTLKHIPWDEITVKCKRTSNSGELERRLIRRLSPPLNRKHNAEFSAIKRAESKTRWRKAAGAPAPPKQRDPKVPTSIPGSMLGLPIEALAREFPMELIEREMAQVERARALGLRVPGKMPMPDTLSEAARAELYYICGPALGIQPPKKKEEDGNTYTPPPDPDEDVFK